MSDIVIGKHTLESLTSGMYSDPYVVFREYIQNAADSIDSAFSTATLNPGEERITISLSPSERKIIIEDNGIGVASENAITALVSIGNSKKSSDNERGFRGIGRLSGLSYCSKLIFETSHFGETIQTNVVFDAQKLSFLLTSDTKSDISVTEVLNEIYSIEKRDSSARDHFFRVIMEGVDESSGLNKFEGVLDYLSQNAPVPYSPDFSWGKEIEKRLQHEGYESRKYNLFLSFGNNTIPVYKSYKDVFLVDKGKSITDSIRDISIIKIQPLSGTISAIGWLAKTNYLGSIYDKAIKGIRIRKGNILIGDSQTLNVIFKDARFNGWSVGEVFVLDPSLVPNARRDNFEKNATYFMLMEQLQNYASEITREIRAASLNRNKELSDILEKAKKPAQSATSAIENGIANNAEKSRITQQLTSAKKAVSDSSISDESGLYFQGIAFNELDMLIGTIKGATSYKAINSLSSLNKTEKKLLEHVFSVIIKQLGAGSDRLIEAIIDELSQNTEPNKQ